MRSDAARAATTCASSRMARPAPERLTPCRCSRATITATRAKRESVLTCERLGEITRDAHDAVPCRAVQGPETDPGVNTRVLRRLFEVRRCARFAFASRAFRALACGHLASPPARPPAGNPAQLTARAGPSHCRACMQQSRCQSPRCRHAVAAVVPLRSVAAERTSAAPHAATAAHYSRR